MALFIFVAVFLMPVFSCELRKNCVLPVYCFVIFLHQLVAFTNAFLFTTLGADVDASTFHQAGVDLASSGGFSVSFGAEFYENMLGIVYWVFGSSHLLGQQLSILAFAVSCIVLMKILRLLGLLAYGVPVLLVFGALPSMVLFGSVTLRESYQVLFFMLAVYFGIKMHIKGGTNVYLVALVMSSLAMGWFHSKGLIAYSVCLIFLLIFWTLRPVSRFRHITKLHLIAMLASLAGFVVLLNLYPDNFGTLTRLIDMGPLDAISDYRAHLLNTSIGRATYDIWDVSSPLATIYSGFLAYVYYLFAPFPWQIENSLDIYASMESFFRMALIYYSVQHWRKSCGEHADCWD